MTTIDCALGIRNRWGASENTFKHVQTRHPFNYHPSFTDSAKQDIANPEKKEKQKELKHLKEKLDSDYKKLANSKESINKDGSPRENSVREKIKLAIRTSMPQSGSNSIMRKIDRYGNANTHRQIHCCRSWRSAMIIFLTYHVKMSKIKRIFDLSWRGL